MSSDITADAVRLALGMQDIRARVASMNIANAGLTGANAKRVDFASAQSALEQAIGAQSEDPQMTRLLNSSADQLRGDAAISTSDPIQLDDQVAEMVAAGTNYQALGDLLSRHFGLLRLAISGRN